MLKNYKKYSLKLQKKSPPKEGTSIEKLQEIFFAITKNSPLKKGTTIEKLQEMFFEITTKKILLGKAPTTIIGYLEKVKTKNF